MGEVSFKLLGRLQGGEAAKVAQQAYEQTHQTTPPEYYEEACYEIEDDPQEVDFRFGIWNDFEPAIPKEATSITDIFVIGSWILENTPNGENLGQLVPFPMAQSQPTLNSTDN